MQKDLDEVEHVLPITVSRLTDSVWNKQFWWPFGAPQWWNNTHARTHTHLATLLPCIEIFQESIPCGPFVFTIQPEFLDSGKVTRSQNMQ